jgi:hypothetical protein
MSYRQHRARTRAHLHTHHHAAVLVRQNVAVQHIKPRIIDEAAPHLEIPRNYLPINGPPPRDREYIPPDTMRAGVLDAGLPILGIA